MAHGRDKYRSRENRRILRDFLMKEWDPIGVAGIPEAHDEYDRYVGQVYLMLVNGNPTAPDMLQYLEDVELDYMRLPDRPERKERREHVAQALIALRSTFLTTH
jgi:hypothetical protein